MIKILSTLILILAIVLFPPAALALISNNSLPGDAPYPIKRKLEDGIILFASLHPVSKAWFSVTRSNRRFQESKTLIKRGEIPYQTLNELLVQTNQAAREIKQVSNSDQKESLIVKYRESVQEYKQTLKEEEERLRSTPEKEEGAPQPPPSGIPSQTPSTFSPAPSKTPTPTTGPSPSPRPTLSPSPRPPGSIQPSPSPTPTPPPTLDQICPPPPANATNSQKADYLKCISNHLQLNPLDVGSDPKSYSLPIDNGSIVSTQTIPLPGGQSSPTTDNFSLLTTLQSDLNSLNIDSIKIVYQSTTPLDCNSLKYRILVYSDPLSTKTTNALTQLDNSLTFLEQFYTAQILSKTQLSSKEKKEFDNLFSSANSNRTQALNSFQNVKNKMTQFNCNINPDQTTTDFINSISNLITTFNNYKTSLLDIVSKILPLL